MGIDCTLPSNVKIGDNVMMGPKCFSSPLIMHIKINQKVFSRKVIQTKKLFASAMMYGSVVKFYLLLAGS